jgi:hypothetical protein
MKTVQMMENIISKTDQFMKAQDKAFETGDWSPVNPLRNELKRLLNLHFDRVPKSERV